METTYIDLDNGIFTDPNDGSQYPCEIIRDDTPSIYGYYYTLYIKYIDPSYITGTLLNIDSRDEIEYMCKQWDLHLAPVNTEFPYFTEQADAYEFCEMLEIELQGKYNGHVDHETSTGAASKFKSKPHRLAGHVQLEFE